MTSEVFSAINSAEAQANSFLSQTDFNDVIDMQFGIEQLGTEGQNVVAWVTVIYLVNM